MPSPTNHQTLPPTSSPSPSPGPIAQQLVRLQGNGQAPSNPPQPTTPSGNAPDKNMAEFRKEVREWLNIIGVLLIPLLIGVYTIANNIQQTNIAQQNRQADVANQLDQQRETALKTYEDDISSLLLDRHLATSRPGDEVRTAALAKTLEVLHQLDGPRNVRAIRFLQDAQLIGTDFTKQTPPNIINFSIADLANVDLDGVDLDGVDLSGANLSWANLSRANLFGANLSRTNLSDADLSEADMSEANLGDANLSEADMSGTNLGNANLSKANLSRANLFGANLSWANLSWANLSGTNLSGTIMPNGIQHSCQRGDESFCK
jgi:uncharacterized protein YjbI with pentapeptide repeats